MNKILILGAIVTLTLSGCDKIEGQSSVIYETVTLVEFNPPKHTYATVRHEDGSIKEHYIGKHCNGWRKKARVGNTYNMYKNTYMYESGKTRTEIKFYKSDFC